MGLTMMLKKKIRVENRLLSLILNGTDSRLTMAKEAHLPSVDDDGQGRDGDAETTVDGNIERTNAVHLRRNIIKDVEAIKFLSDIRLTASPVSQQHCRCQREERLL